MLEYAIKGATLMCTGCPGVPAQLDADEAPTVRSNTNTQATEADKKIMQPGFGMCIAIPSAPKKCSPNLGEWANIKSDVRKKGKAALLYPNMIPCMAGPGMVTMVTSGARVERIGASSDDAPKENCIWKGHEHKHETVVKKFPGEGNTKRENLGSWEWIRPKNIYDYHKEPYNLIKCATLWGIQENSTLDTYPTQKHHVIPVKSISQLPDLCANLELLGYEINNENNGIRLPMYDEDIFWHDLPRHYNWTVAHSAYNDTIMTELKRNFNSKWKFLCNEDEEENLLIEIQKYVDLVRNKMIQWNPDYFVVENGGNRDHSFTNAGYVISNHTTVPKINTNRRYPCNSN